MSKAAMNLQDSFLNQVRRENTEVKVILVSGAGLRGVVKGFDNFTVILQNRSGQHLIYKHAIAQLVNQRQGGIKREGDETTGAEGEGESTGADEMSGEATNATPFPAATPAAAAGSQPGRRDDQGRGRREGQGQPRREGQGQPRRDDQARPPRREEQPQVRRDEQNQAPAQTSDKQRKDGFNRLDLSAVRLASEAEEKIESQ